MPLAAFCALHLPLYSHLDAESKRHPPVIPYGLVQQIFAVKSRNTIRKLVDEGTNLVLAVVFVVVVSIHLTFGTCLAQLPTLVPIVIVVVDQMLLQTHLVMPQVTRLLRPWLFADDSARRG